ncbi:MAG: polymer-forming cytoskeletal protein [Bacillota bacterium]
MFKKNSLDVSSDKVNTIIGKGTIFQGTMVGNGLIRIDGEAKGDITNKGDVIIGESGTVVVDLKARNVTIAGHFEGSIEAEGRLELKKTSTAVGKFKVNSLLIEEGAIISGGMEMSLKDKDKNKVLRKQDDQGENNSEAR